MKKYYLYIMASISKVIYVGMTNDINRRVSEHKLGEIEGFTKKYCCKKLVYIEETGDVLNAIQREKQIKKWNRKKKIDLIESINEKWLDLSLNP
ncbi:GIY-YIG nuclease family protein [Candidatus Gracilibacteria bacterium]|nr:GIY-YIG nuclease family protein [Candidatus Gracilibacteria bacterium]